MCLFKSYHFSCRSLTHARRRHGGEVGRSHMHVVEDTVKDVRKYLIFSMPGLAQHDHRIVRDPNLVNSILKAFHVLCGLGGVWHEEFGVKVYVKSFKPAFGLLSSDATTVVEKTIGNSHQAFSTILSLVCRLAPPLTNVVLKDQNGECDVAGSGIG